MKLSVGEKVVEAKVQETKKAQQTYDDNIAKGNMAVILKKSKNSENLLEIDIGGLLPGKTAKVEIVIIQVLEV